MALEEIRIQITGDAKALQPTVDKLAELGAVDKKNAEQFKQSNAEFIEANKKRTKLLEEEKQDLLELQRAKKAAFSPEEIKAYERSIKESQERIRLLSADLGMADKSMAKVVVSTNAMGESIKKSYGFLRLAANIIPGLGISGLILASYEILANMLKELTFSYEDNTEAIELNNEAMEKQIAYQSKLEEIIQANIQARLVLSKKLTDTDVARFKAQDDYSKRDEEISKNKLEYIKKLADTYKMDAEDFKQYSSRIAKASELTVDQIKAIEESLKLSDNEGLPSSLDQRLATVQSYVSKLEQYEVQVRIDRKKNEVALTEQVGAIQEGGYQSSLKKLKVRKEKEDDWWKIYLRMWKQNFDELLRMYKKDGDDFVNEAEKKWKEAVKRQDDNIALMIDNDQLEASLTQSKIDDENAAYQERLNNFKIQQDENGKITEESQRHIELLEKQHNQNLLHIQYDAEQEKNKLAEKAAEERKKKRQEEFKETVDNLKQISDFVIKEYEARLEANISYIDHKEDLNRKDQDTQRQLAIAGKDSTLAFEQKQAADLEKQRAQEAKKLKRAKELEIFLNALASFSKDDPKQALGKALALMATAIATEATFMEEGGILGKTKNKSWSGRKHRGGGDILVHAQTGEGMFSRKEVANMGGEGAFMDFKNLLARPLREKPIPMSGVMFHNTMDTKRLEEKFDSLERTIKNKKETSIDFDGMGNMIVTSTENGIRETVKHILRKPRL